MNPYPAPKKKTSTLRVVAFVLLGVTVLVCGVSVLAVALAGQKPAAVTAPPVVAVATPTAPPAETPAAAKTPEAPKTPAAPAAPSIADGTWTVGEDIPAGTYKVTGADKSCYWAIYKSGQNQSLDAIIDNHLGGGNLRVTLKAGQDFETQRCGTWQKV